MTERDERGNGLWGLLVAAGLVLMEFLLFSSLVPTDWAERMREQETRWLVEEMQPRTAERIVTTAQDWYGRLFLRTGLVELSYRLLLPDDEDRRRTPELKALNDSPVWLWLKGRLDVIWLSVYTAVQRLVVLLAWWPFLGFAGVAAAGDGLLRRRIRQSGFAYASPLAHRYAMYGLYALGVLVLFGLFVPVALPPFGVPIMGGLAAIGVGVILTHTQKAL